MLKNILKNHLLIREVGNVTHRAGYKDLWLGYGWSYLEPLIFTFVYYLFVRLVRSGDAEHTGVFILIIMSGQTVYDWFSKTIAGAPGTLNKYQGILLTKRIDPLLLVAADFYYYFKASLSRYILLLAALPLFGVIPSVIWLLAIPLVVLTAAFLFPVAVILGIFGVYVKDATRITSTVARLMIFVTPVLFSIQDIKGELRTFIELNPIALLIGQLRSVLLYQSIPELYGIAYVLVLSVFLWLLAELLLGKFGHQLAKEL
jgi:ABC-type polysaccharide/polyol phosphate export permease